MGFPDLPEVLAQPDNKKYPILGFYVTGLLSWIYLLPIVTEPKWYSNELYWKWKHDLEENQKVIP